MSTSTGAPAALARSEGHMLATNGTAAATPATPPDHAGGDHQVAPRLVYFFLLVHGDGVVVRLQREARKSAILAAALANVHDFAP